jgi:DNA invertase Pin-like site-specific DNA recombinase
MLRQLPAGDVLVVVCIGRLALSLPHLLTAIMRVREVGRHLRSLSNPIDTVRPRRMLLYTLGHCRMLVLQIIGASRSSARRFPATASSP